MTGATARNPVFIDWMNMYCKLRLFLLSLVFTLCASLSLAAETTAVIDDGHRKAVTRMLRAMEFSSMVLQGMRDGMVQRYGGEPSAPWLRRLDGPEAMDRMEAKLLPFIAPIMPRDDALRLTSFLETSAGRKVVAFWREQAKKPDLRFDGSRLTPAERVEFMKFATSPLPKRIEEITKALKDPQLVAAMKSFIEESNLDPLGETRSFLADRMENALDQPEGAAAPPARRPPPSEPLALLFDRFMTRMMDIGTRYANAAKTSDLGDWLAPEKLAQPGSVNAGRESLQKLRLALAQRQTDISKAMDEALQEGRQLPMPADTRQLVMTEFERGLSRGYARQIAFTENQQRILDLYGRILGVVESAQGGLTASEGRLVFNDERLAAEYNTLFGDLQREAQREAEITQASQEAVRTIIKKLR
jgi:hypothetical protein